MSHRWPGTGVSVGITGQGAGQEQNNTMEVKLMETTMNNIHPGTSNPADDARQHSAASRPAGRPGDDVVRWSEFRLALWVGGLALTAILGSQGFLYSAIMDLQRDMYTQFNELNGRVHELNGRVHELSERVHELSGRVNELNGRVHELNGRVNELNGRVNELNGRVARIETRLDMDVGPADPAG